MTQSGKAPSRMSSGDIGSISAIYNYDYLRLYFPHSKSLVRSYDDVLFSAGSAMIVFGIESSGSTVTRWVHGLYILDLTSNCRLILRKP